MISPCIRPGLYSCLQWHLLFPSETEEMGSSWGILLRSGDAGNGITRNLPNSA